MDHKTRGPALSTNCVEIKEIIVYMLNEADILLLDDAHCRGHCAETQAAGLLVLAAIEQFPLSSRLLHLGHWCWAFVSDLAGFSACTHAE